MNRINLLYDCWISNVKDMANAMEYKIRDGCSDISRNDGF